MQIAETIEKVLRPKGVAVVVEAIHLCMMMRGVEQQNAFAITSSHARRLRERPEDARRVHGADPSPKESFA